MDDLPRLSQESVRVLNLIAEGHSYAQIVDKDPTLTYVDIFVAAQEAVWLDERIATWATDSESSTCKVGPKEKSTMDRTKEQYLRAYVPWLESEEAELCSMLADGKSKSEIAVRLQRQPSAIDSRMRKLGLL